ncbi:hypothetical protein KP509_33G056600 [Ceratopteris richardii]|nr:hypothetical protein KP509_33G056600 [Ceratopteris richardii]
MSKYRPTSLLNRFITPSPCSGQPPPSSSTSSSEHPVEAIARIRQRPEGSDTGQSFLQVTQSGQTVRIRTDQGYRDFGLDGISVAEEEDLPSFYKKYVERRVELVKSGGRCTIMMYGPTGAGKSHTMFGSTKEPGIAYRALQNILGGHNGSSEKPDEKPLTGSPSHATGPTHVVVTILEIYNEEVFDLLAASNNPKGRWTRRNLSRARLEVMGKKAKNAVSITGTDPEKISREIVKVEKRRVTKSTLCNDRSSRSHCMVMVEIPSLGGRLVLVDMAGSENLEQAGIGLDSKLQTGKINQGNVALKRVVEAIANGDSYIPFRDSKLTMLLQDSFEDDQSKILMILCASPDPRDMHKTIGTLEYGCKAKCIVSLPVSPAKETLTGHGSALEARVKAMDAHISRLEADNRSKEKEKEEMCKALKQKDEDLTALRQTLEQMDKEAKKQQSALNEDLRTEMETRIRECQRASEEYAAMEKKLEEKLAEQQREIDSMRSRMKEIEREVERFLSAVPMFSHALAKSANKDGTDIVGKMRGVLECMDIADTENRKMQLGFSVQLQGTLGGDNKDATSTSVVTSHSHDSSVKNAQILEATGCLNPELYVSDSEDPCCGNEQQHYEQTGWLSPIPEEESDAEEEMMLVEDVEDSVRSSTEKEKYSLLPNISDYGSNPARISEGDAPQQVNMEIDEGCSEEDGGDSSSAEVHDTLTQNPPSMDFSVSVPEGVHDPANAASRRTRIENIFMLCGNRRELAAVSNVQNRSSASDGNGANTGNELPRDVSVMAQVASANTTKEIVDRRAGNGGDKVHVSLPPAKSRHPFSSENTPPPSTAHHHAQSIGVSSASHHSKSPANVRALGSESISSAKNADEGKNSSALSNQPEFLDMYVKWETSKDSTGKLIGTIKMRRDSNLAELRAELQRRALDPGADYVFLLLGDPSGNPVDGENEKTLPVTCLPDCHKQRGTKLACLRPHHLHHSTTESAANKQQGPLCSRENQIAWNSPNRQQTTAPSPSQKSPLFRVHALRPPSTQTHQSNIRKDTSQRLSLPLASQVKGLRL